MLCVLLAPPAQGHRLDEYLQACLVTLERNRVQIELDLTPGVAVLPLVMSAIDTDGDGMLSQAERDAYASQVLRDLSLSVDGQRIPARLLSSIYPSLPELQEGLGTIRLEIAWDLSSLNLDATRHLRLENRHQRRTSVYLINSLVPTDPAIRILNQSRNELQSVYSLDYQAGPSTSSWTDVQVLTAGVALLLLGRLTFLGFQTNQRRHK